MSAHSLTRDPLVRIGLPIFGGVLVAAGCVLMLATLPTLWIGLLFCAGLVVLPSLVVNEPMAYWLYLLLLSLPFDISKMLANPDRAIDLLETFGAPWGGPPELSLHLTDLLAVPILGLWLLGKIRRRERIWFPRINYLPLAFLCFTTVTALVAPFPFFAFLELMRQWKYFALYVFAADALDLRTYGKTILTILLLTLLMQGTLTMVRYRFQYVAPVFGEAFGRTTYLTEEAGARSVTGDAEGPERGLGTFLHANATAMHLEFLLPFALAGGLLAPTRRKKVAYALLFLVGAAGHYVTFSRTGLIAFLASILVCTFVAALRGWIPRRMLGALLGIGLLGTVALVPLMVAYIGTRPTYSEYHMEHLRQGLTIALHHPIFGVGLSNSSVVRPHLISTGLMYGENLLPIHSQYLIGISETGLIGFSLYIGFFILIALDAFRRTKSDGFYERIFSMGVLGTLAAMSIHMITDFMGPVPFHVLLWLYAGLIIAQRRGDTHAGVLAARS